MNDTMPARADRIYRFLLRELEKTTGIRVIEVDESGPEWFRGTYTGLTLHLKKVSKPVIMIDSSLDRGVNLDILLHEIGHAFCHFPGYGRGCEDEQSEREAYAFAALVMNGYGLSHEAHANFLAEWLGSSDEQIDSVKVVGQAFERFWTECGHLAKDM